jgi:hypothetical protein
VNQSPSSIASIAFDKAVFGKHPYAHETIGTQDTISLKKDFWFVLVPGGDGCGGDSDSKHIGHGSNDRNVVTNPDNK